MHKRSEPSGKRKNDMRWEQGRKLYETVTPTLPSAAHVAVLMYCWFHARGRECQFSESRSQIAAGTKLSEVSIKRILRELERGGVIRTTEQSIGRGNTARRVVTGKPYAVADKGGHP